MSDKPTYSSLIDCFLDSREPNWKDLGLKDAKSSGDEWLSRTHDEEDTAFVDALVEGKSRETALPARVGALQGRLIEKEDASPRLGIGHGATTRTAGRAEDDDSLLEEVTESLEEAAKGGKVEKKNRSDGEIKRYVHELLNQGTTPSKVAVNLKKLAESMSFDLNKANAYLQKNAGLLGVAYLEPHKRAEIELFDKTQNMGNSYLNNSNAGGTGAEVLQPNTFMDAQNPAYNHTAELAPNFNSRLQQAQDKGGLLGSIRAGDRVTIVDRFGKERSGRAVMFGPGGWVLNMGGRYGTPGIADEENIVKVRKAPKQAAVLDTEEDKVVEAAVASVDMTEQEYNEAGFNAVVGYDIARARAADEGLVEPAPYNSVIPTEADRHLERLESLRDIYHGMADSRQASASGEEEVEDETPIVTPVIFRKWKDTGSVLALFPEDLGTNDPYTCSSYEHVGQHGSADPQGCIQATVPASPAEYAGLKKELESLGYKLKPMSRLQYRAIETRKTKLNQYHSNNIPESEQDISVEEPSNKASSQDCVRQASAWKSAGITPRAKSVKQVSACAGCTYFKKEGSSKTCNLYHLPVVGSAGELNKVVNRMTAGVPSGSKKAALVQIANRTDERKQTTTSMESPFVHQASFTHERQKGMPEVPHFGGAQVQKLHAAGHSLKAIAAAVEKEFGAIESSKAIREFIASLHKGESGKIVMAKADADYINKIGIHNNAIIGAAKCASCKSHKAVKEYECKNCDHEMTEHKDGKCVHSPENCQCVKGEKVAMASTMVTRAPETFVQVTPTQKKVGANFDSGTVSKLHEQGHSLDKIYKAASSKIGSVKASKAIREWAQGLNKTNTKIALSQIDCTVLNKMGVKLGTQNAILGAEKCGSCSYRNGMHCGLTGGTLLSFPGMNQIASNKKVAAGAPEDGRAILNEFDLMGSAPQGDIQMNIDRDYEVK